MMEKSYVGPTPRQISIFSILNFFFWGFIYVHIMNISYKAVDRQTHRLWWKASFVTGWSVSPSDVLLFVKLPTPASNLETFSSNSCWKHKKTSRPSSRRRCSWIRKLLKERSMARGIVCLHLSSPSTIISTGAANWKRAWEMRLLAAKTIYYSQLVESWESFVFISVNSNYVCD